MNLVNPGEGEIAVGASYRVAENGAVVGIQIQARAIDHLHHLGQIRCPRELYDKYLRVMRLVLGDRDQIVFGQRTAALSDIPELRMEPVRDIVLERHDAAGEAEDDEKNSRGESDVKMDGQNNLPQIHSVSFDDRR